MRLLALFTFYTVGTPKARSHLWGLISSSLPLHHFESCLRRRSFDIVVQF